MSATPAPTDRGDRMSTPTPGQVPSVKVDRQANALYVTLDAARMVASTVETNSQVNVDYDSGGAMVGIEILDLDFPAASAPQGDTPDVIARARCVLAESYDGIDPDVETRHDGAVANLAAAGLLAVAASPAPESLNLEALAGACRAYVSAWDDQHADSTVLGSLAGRVALAASPAAPQAGGEVLRAGIAEVLADLKGSPCSFWACPGVDEPITPMATCSTCATQIRLRELLAASLVAPAPVGREAAVERLAKALFRRGQERRSRRVLSQEEADKSWDAASKFVRNECRDVARAALAALKEGQKA